MHIVKHTLFVIARRERSEGRGNPSCLEGTQTSLSLRFQVHSGSPRAFSPRDDKMGSGFLCMSLNTHFLSLRGGSGARDAAIHRVSRGRKRVCLFAYKLTVDRHGLRPRDDKMGSGFLCISLNTHFLSLRGESGARDAAIHRVSRDADGLSLRLLVHSGSPRAFSPRDDKMWSGFLCMSLNTHCLSLRGESGARDAAIHRVSRDADGLSLRLLVHSGSPRAFSPRDDKS